MTYRRQLHTAARATQLTMVATRTKDYADSTPTPPPDLSEPPRAARPPRESRPIPAQEEAPGPDDGQPTAKPGLLLHEPTLAQNGRRHRDAQQRRHPPPAAQMFDPGPQRPQHPHRAPIQNDQADAPPAAPVAVLARPDDDPHDDPHPAARAQPNQGPMRPDPHPPRARWRLMPSANAVLAFLRRHGLAVGIVVLVLTMAGLYILNPATFWRWLLCAFVLLKVFPGMTPWLEQVPPPIWTPAQPVVAVGAVCEEVFTCMGACTFKSSCR
ncbi:hypothetical protein FB567DRAFT_612841 [Paraphoma chrysanthemicola]|uniref:Uncharacterized protein n=1 Tax=Paraphoma chrysanthemicola TaxID=798071 RepID=A0A8K0VS45_9PLEO|nr:hypothetical protein FB567DRAFT_612841 [Paraphoma chrysanthemicola]